VLEKLYFVFLYKKLSLKPIQPFTQETTYMQELVRYFAEVSNFA